MEAGREVGDGPCRGGDKMWSDDEEKQKCVITQFCYCYRPNEEKKREQRGLERESGCGVK